MNIFNHNKYLITPDATPSIADFLLKFKHAIQKGPTLAQLRTPSLIDDKYFDLAKQIKNICASAGVKLLLNNNVAMVNAVSADGIHLSSAKLLACHTRPLDQSKVVGASCHTLEELRHAEFIGVDFVTLSPVLPTTSHPGQAHLGWEQFRTWACSVKLPVFALGGVDLQNLQQAIAHGAVGIAAITAFWST